MRICLWLRRKDLYRSKCHKWKRCRRKANPIIYTCSDAFNPHFYHSLSSEPTSVLRLIIHRLDPLVPASFVFEYIAVSACCDRYTCRIEFDRGREILDLLKKYVDRYFLHNLFAEPFLEIPFHMSPKFVLSFLSRTLITKASTKYVDLRCASAAYDRAIFILNT